MTRERIRPRPSAGSLSAQVLALACRDKGADQRPLGATSNDELAVWCEDLAAKLATYGDLEAAHARIAELEQDPDNVIADDVEGRMRTELATTLGGGRESTSWADLLAEVETHHNMVIDSLFPQHAQNDAVRAAMLRVLDHPERDALLAAEAQLVDLLALELEFVRMLRAAGVLPAEGPPPPTTDLLALVRSMRS